MTDGATTPLESDGPDVLEVRVTVAAPPDRVWSLIADPTRMGEWSPQCRRLEWVGPVRAPVVGARFRGHNRNGFRRWSTTCRLVEYVPGARIAWEVHFAGLPVSRWAYRVEQDGAGGCALTEQFVDRRGPVMHALGALVRGTRDARELNREQMTATLAAVAAAAAG